MNRRRVLAALGALALDMLWRRGASAQATPPTSAWPERPIRLIVPFPAGGGTDVISRQLAERMAANTGWTIVVENRAGAGGNIGLDAVAKAAPDGYTIGMGQASNLAVNPALYARMPYDPLKDFAPISSIASQGLVVVVSAKSAFRSLADLIAAAKQKPDGVSLAHAGNGTIGHLAGEMLSRLAGVKILTPASIRLPIVVWLLADIAAGRPLVRLRAAEGCRPKAYWRPSYRSRAAD
jgi:tripartite-type tricarboxylate transporter receptor subunit TctC